MKKMWVITSIVLAVVILFAVLGYFYFSASNDSETTFLGAGYETLDKSSIPDTNPFDNANPFASESSSSEENE